MPTKPHATGKTGAARPRAAAPALAGLPRGYGAMRDVPLELDPRNPQLAARMVSQLAQWRRYEPKRRALMQRELERIAAEPKLSKDVRENVERMIK